MRMEKAINTIIDYNWIDEQKNWEERTGKIYPNKKPNKKDNHIFNALHNVSRFLYTQVKYKKKTMTLNDLLEKMSNEDLIKAIVKYKGGRK